MSMWEQLSLIAKHGHIGSSPNQKNQLPNSWQVIWTRLHRVLAWPSFSSNMLSRLKDSRWPSNFRTILLETQTAMLKFMLSVSEIPGKYAGQDLQAWMPTSKHMPQNQLCNYTETTPPTPRTPPHQPETTPTPRTPLHQPIPTYKTKYTKRVKEEDNSSGWINLQMTNVQVLQIAFH